jgi:phage-related tail protein
VIWNHRIASRTRPGAGWRRYTRYDNLPHPSASQLHTNHVHISWYKKGTDSARRGLAVVGEHGPELVNMKGGEQVRPATHAPDYRFAPWGGPGGGSGAGGGDVYYIEVNAPNYVGSQDDLKRTLVTMFRSGALKAVSR